MQISSPINPPHALSSPSKRSNTPRARSLLLLCLATLLTLTAAPTRISAQSLAHRNWAGSGITPDAWWRHAIFYRIDAAPLPTLAEIPSLQAFGIDAILLTPQSIPPQPPNASQPNSAEPAPTPNQPLALNDLLFQCSRLHIHVFLPLDLAAPNADPARTLDYVRSWLTRGASGFVILNLDKNIDKLLPSTPSSTPPTTSQQTSTARHRIHLAPPTAEPQILTEIRTMVAQFPGHRILIGAPSDRQTSAFQLQIVTLPPRANPIRLAMLNARTSPPALLSLQNRTALTPVDATRLLVTNAPAILDSAALPASLLLRVFPPLSKFTLPPPTANPAPPPPSPSVYGAFVPYVPKNTYADQQRKLAAAKAAEAAKTEKALIDAATFPVQSNFQPISDTPIGYTAFYYHLIQLHRTNAALQNGMLHALDTGSPTAFAWLATHGNAPPLIVACNPTPTKITLDLSHALRGVATSSEMLRTLLHTASTPGVTDPDAIPIGPQGVYAGILAHGYVYR